MFFRFVMIGWCFALTVVVAANQAPTRFAPQELLSPTASFTDCRAPQLRVDARHEANCSCGNAPLSSSLVKVNTGRRGDLPSPAMAELSSPVTLAVAVAEPVPSESPDEPLDLNELAATSPSKNDAALAAYLARREMWGRYPSQSTVHAPSVAETPVEASGTRESIATVTEQPNGAIIALSVDTLEDLFRVRESWRSAVPTSSNTQSRMTAKGPIASEDALKAVGEVTAPEVPSSNQEMADTGSEIDAALVTLLAKRESWGKAPSKSTADALPRSQAQTKPITDGFADTASADVHQTDALRAFLARRETWGKTNGDKTATGPHRRAPLQSMSLALAKQAKKARALNASKLSRRSRRLRARSHQRRKSVRALTTQRTWQERVLFPL